MSASAAGGGGSVGSSRADPLCSFCQHAPAALQVKGQLVDRPLCLLHFYTTRSVRACNAKSKLLPVSDGKEMRRQLPHIQSLFAEAYTDLKREVAEEAARAINRSERKGVSPASRGSSTTSNDPLGAMLQGAGGSSISSASKRGRKGRHSGSAAGTTTEKFRAEEFHAGGFVRDVVLPDRYTDQQRRMDARRTTSSGATNPRTAGPRSVDDHAGSVAIPSASAAARRGKEAEGPSSTSNPYKRRKGGKTSYWDVHASSGRANDAADGFSKAKKRKLRLEDLDDSIPSNATITCTCGSLDVNVEGNVGSRNNDVSKAETWGNKDRSDEVVVRCRCRNCGKMWNEEL